MWLDCNNVFINMKQVDYIAFEKSEDKYTAIVYFVSGDSLNFEHPDLQVLKDHFKKIFEVKNGETAEVG